MEENISGRREGTPMDLIQDDPVSGREVNYPDTFRRFVEDMVRKIFEGYSWFFSSRYHYPTRVQCTLCKTQPFNFYFFLSHVTSKAHVERMLHETTVKKRKNLAYTLLESLEECREEVKRASAQKYREDESTERVIIALEGGIEKLHVLIDQQMKLLKKEARQRSRRAQRQRQSCRKGDHFDMKIDENISTGKTPVVIWYQEFLSILKKNKWSEVESGQFRCRLCETRLLSSQQYVLHLSKIGHIHNLTGKTQNPETTEILFEHLTALEDCYTSLRSLKRYFSAASELFNHIMEPVYYSTRDASKQSVQKMQAYVKEYVESNMTRNNEEYDDDC